MRDSQRGKAYAWERELRAILGCQETIKHFGPREAKEVESELDIESLHSLVVKRTEKECRELVYKMRWQAGMRKSPILSFVEKGACHYNPNGHLIRLAEWGMDYLVVTHEMCHAIVDDIFWDHQYAPHGREFVGLMIHFLERNFKVNRNVLARLANEQRVDFTIKSPKEFRMSVAALPRG